MADVVIINYGMGNVRSVKNAVEYCGFNAAITADPQKIADASHVILPGVGAFGEAMANLKSSGLVEILEEKVRAKGKPMLGICLGMQVLAHSSTEHSEHGNLHRGLGWVRGRGCTDRSEGWCT
jgi:glutamine amidotransferase